MIVRVVVSDKKLLCLSAASICHLDAYMQGTVQSADLSCRFDSIIMYMVLRYHIHNRYHTIAGTQHLLYYLVVRSSVAHVHSTRIGPSNIGRKRLHFNTPLKQYMDTDKP